MLCRVALWKLVLCCDVMCWPLRRVLPTTLTPAGPAAVLSLPGLVGGGLLL